MRVVIDSMAHLPKNEIDQQTSFLMLRRLIAVPKADSFNPNPEPIKLYKESKQSISIPREFFFKNAQHDNSIIDMTSEGFPMQELPPIKLEARRNQHALVSQVMKHLMERKSFGGILNAETGTGKTVMSLEIARRIGRCTLIRVYKDDLADQWESRIKQFLPEARVGRIQGSNLDYKDKDFVIAMIQTLVSRRDQFRENDDLVNAFGLDITDEVHRTGSREWGSTADIFNSKFRLGLSATVRRKDNCERVFKDHIGQIIAVGKGIAMKADVFFFETGFKYPESVDFNSLPMVTQLKWLARNVYRNKVIVNKLVQAIASGRKIIVLSKFVDHLQTLERLTSVALQFKAKSDPKFESLGNKKLGFYVGALHNGETRINRKGEEVAVKVQQTKKDLAKASKASCIFATYKKAEDALDIPDLDTLFMVLPISDPEQAVGRILRIHEEKKTPLVVDVTDENVGLCSGMKRARVRHYEAKGWGLKVGR